MADTSAALTSVAPVSRETLGRLEVFVALLRKWQPAENLVAPSTLPEIWHRHVADCAQLPALFPDARSWLDLGTGAGFPGLVIAILLSEQPDAMVHLVESNLRKCAFLRAVIRETGAQATVHAGRIETVLQRWVEPVDRVTARALAPLDDLLSLAEPVMGQGTPAAFMKGRDFQTEVDHAAEHWRFDLLKHDSRVGGGGVILDIRNLRRKGESG